MGLSNLPGVNNTGTISKQDCIKIISEFILGKTGSELSEELDVKTSTIYNHKNGDCCHNISISDIREYINEDVIRNVNNIETEKDEKPVEETDTLRNLRDIQKLAGRDQTGETQNVYEILNPEKIEEFDITSDVNKLATYSTSENGVKYRIIPQFAQRESYFELWVFLPNVHGPVIRTVYGIPNNQARELGISQELLKDLNWCIQQSNQCLNISYKMRGQSTVKRSLYDLKQKIANSYV